MQKLKEEEIMKHSNMYVLILIIRKINEIIKYFKPLRESMKEAMEEISDEDIVEELESKG